ncbi:MAG: hypothetical protein K9M80_03030 [Candidatus Marinimicrobia bacterium]|nr:hypothetical protein [Candidatus Neomarinimicrobiota bacterium]
MSMRSKSKIGFRDLFFLILGILVFSIIAIVDISFYHVPSFIKNFNTEREIIVILAFLALLPFLSDLSEKLQKNGKKTLYITICLLFGLVLIVSLVQLFGGNMINLWNNNPLLAENPDSWILFSTAMTIFAVSIIILLLFNIRFLILLRTGKKSDLFFKLSILLIVAFSLILNFYEDHYSYKQLGNIFPINDLSRFAWLSVGAIFFTITSLKNSWVEAFNSKEKLVALICIMSVLGVSLYFYLSPLITKLYAMSVTIKGFILGSFAFIIIYFLMATLKILFLIPLIRYHDQVTKELNAVREISELISSSNEEKEIINKIIKHITEITNTDICWLEKLEDNTNYNILSKKNITSGKASNISKIVQSKINKGDKDLYFIDLINDRISDYIALEDKNWKTLMVVPVKGETIDIILYLISSKKSSFNTRNINSLRTFLSMLKILKARY